MIRISSAPQISPALSSSSLSQAGQTGVVLCNLGTPAAADEAAVRVWLAAMLSDRRIVNLPPLLWKPILYGAILRRRPAPVAEKYAAIWDHARDSSPLLSLTQCLSDGVRRRWQEKERLEKGQAETSLPIRIATAMRYGAPSVPDVLEGLVREGCRRLLVVPLYPQFSFSTSESITDAVRLWHRHTRIGQRVKITYAPSWYENKTYIAALADSIEKSFAQQKIQPELLLVSFHGLPEKSVRQGDPYRSECEATFRLLQAELRIRGWGGNIQLTFQSRFGPMPWLQPYTADQARTAAHQGVRHLAVATPGFATDCLETLEEIGVELRDSFLAAGGTSFVAVPCLNASGAHAELLVQLIAANLRSSLHNGALRG